MDKMTIVGADGKPRFEMAPDNTITDLRDICNCTEPNRPEQRDGEKRVCLICGNAIK